MGWLPSNSIIYVFDWVLRNPFSVSINQSIIYQLVSLTNH